VELQDYLRVVRAHWLGILVIAAVTIGLAGAYTLTQPKVYAADANGFVTSGAANDAATASVNDSLAKSRAASYVNIATSRAVADLVIDDLKLDTSPSSLIGRISVDQPLDTVLIKISAEADSPAAAQRLADAWIRALSVRVAEIENPAGSGAAGIIGVEPVEAAALPTTPISPRPALNLGGGLVIGLLLGFVYAVIRSRLDRRLRDSEQVERAFQVPIVGRVPVAPGTDAERADITAAAGGDIKHWGASEAFRKLRTNVAYMSVDNPPRVIVVTSPRPGDGKSTTASNLAAAIAQSGYAVTLVDGDLRRPTVASTLGLVEGAGLTDVLIGSVTIDDVIQQHASVPTLSVMAAGSVPPNPSELLGSHAMQGLIKSLAERGMVVIDAPPLLPVTDAAVLTRHSDGAIVVISYGSTLDSELEDALTQLRNVNGTVLGLVFNRVPRKDNRYGGYYGGYYTESVDGETPGPTKTKTKKVAERKGTRKA
jgi:capsular exopolysaccharide synthesis family protein